MAYKDGKMITEEDEEEDKEEEEEDGSEGLYIFNTFKDSLNPYAAGGLFGQYKKRQKP